MLNTKHHEAPLLLPPRPNLPPALRFLCSFSDPTDTPSGGQRLYRTVAVLQTLAAIPTLPSPCRTYRLFHIFEAFLFFPLSQSQPVKRKFVSEVATWNHSKGKRTVAMSVVSSSARSGVGFRADVRCLCSLNTE